MHDKQKKKQAHAPTQIKQTIKQHKKYNTPTNKQTHTITIKSGNTKNKKTEKSNDQNKTQTNKQTNKTRKHKQTHRHNENIKNQTSRERVECGTRAK